MFGWLVCTQEIKDRQERRLRGWLQEDGLEFWVRNGQELDEISSLTFTLRGLKVYHVKLLTVGTSQCFIKADENSSFQRLWIFNVHLWRCHFKQNHFFLFILFVLFYTNARFTQRLGVTVQHGLIHFKVFGRFATSGITNDSEHWRQKVGVSKNATKWRIVQLHANDKGLLGALPTGVKGRSHYNDN